MNTQISDLVINYDRISFVAAVVLHSCCNIVASFNHHCFHFRASFDNSFEFFSVDLHSHRQIPIFTALLERLAQNKKACYEALQRSQRNLMGEDLGPLSGKDLETLESQLDSSLKQIRSTRLVESVLTKVVEEFEHRIASQDEQELKHTVQTTKAGSIRVYCRVRPFLSGQPNHLSTVENMEDELSQLMFLQRMGKGADPSTLTKSLDHLQPKGKSSLICSHSLMAKQDQEKLSPCNWNSWLVIFWSSCLFVS